MRNALVALILFALQGSYAILAVAADNGIPANPWIADSPYAISHHDPAQTDVTPVDGPTIGGRIRYDQAQTVPVVWCSAPIYKRVGEETVVVASTPMGLIKVRATGDDFSVVSSVPYPNRESVHAEVTDARIAEVMNAIDEKRRAKQDWRLLFNSLLMYYKFNINMRTMPSGAYALFDRDGYHYTFYDRQHLVKSFDQNEVEEPLVPLQYANIVSQLPRDDAKGIDRILGINMTYDGFIVAAAAGAVIITDRELNVVDYHLFPGELVENSIAVDRDNGIYVVTSVNMHKLVWTGSALSQNAEDGAWSSPYDVMPRGMATDMGAASHGSGTTPSLLGFGDDEDKLVVISDGNAENAQIVAFWRNKIPQDFKQKPGTQSRRIADQISFRLSKTTVEASPVVYGNGVLVVNSTYPEPGPIPMDLISNAFLAGTTREPPRGIQKYEWLPGENRFIESWGIDDVDNTDWMPPAVSTANGLVYIANKRDDNYEYFAADWKTGEKKATWEFPDDSVLWNTWGGITVFLPDGDFLLGGFFAIKRYDTGDMRKISRKDTH
ncbi:hypothetical protein [Candidatus Marimicrobium litorale]|jgi:hypothetical protein|uniref:Uncharacterized protein n=1 Tax=Candidatus Marimicrobium litorale TaxID=2518991 RepID=A0ABT3T5U8_9GAMM|nr:hypothetical protein [Candidatus Marimicrobium litorale]MCX2977191.1 hypothetical protein [Candidatus Marimicrobium litorale]